MSQIVKKEQNQNMWTWKTLYEWCKDRLCLKQEIPQMKVV